MEDETSVDALLKQLREAQQRAEAAEQRAEAAEQRADDAEEQTRPTTLRKYIETCHNQLFATLAVETNKSFTSQGSITNPRNKSCPTRLEPWDDFIPRQRATFGSLYSTFPSDFEAFETLGFLRGLGDRVSRKKIASEKDLESFLHNTVEDPVRSIVERLAADRSVRLEFDTGAGIVFENNPSALSDVAEEVVAARHAGQPGQPAPSTPPHAVPDLTQLRADQICVYRYDNGDSRRSIAYIVEYKAPHKLTAPHLRLGLRPMDILAEVVNRPTRPTADDPDALFQYHADRLAAAAVTQTFHYMIEAGLEYGLLTTGEAMVFLNIDWSDPTVLYYHLAEPGPEADAHPENLHVCTAVAQVLAFTLMALGSPGQRRLHGQDECQAAIDCLSTWNEDYDAILRSIPVSERKPPPDSPAYEPQTYESVDRSPYRLRQRKQPPSHPPDNVTIQRQPPTSSDDEGHHPDSPTRRRPKSRGRHPRAQRAMARRPRGGQNTSGPADAESRQHCTQKCLLGLVHGKALDEKCPNIARHRRRGRSHPLNHAKCLDLLRNQLHKTLDRGVKPLGKQGARGALFKVTLLEYGYTFVAKGTVEEFVPHLQHEAAVYDRLRPIQGDCVPVCLGVIDLRDINRTYYYDFRVRIVYMLLLSWAGPRLSDPSTLQVLGRAPDQNLKKLLEQVHALGVAHNDVRGANIVCPGPSQLMLVDFERATLFTPRPPLAQVARNKRARIEGVDCKALGRLNSASQYRDVDSDLLAAKSLFIQ